MIEIEKNVPLILDRKCKYPFRDMEIGDSFFIHSNGESLAVIQRNLLNASKHYEGKFITRQVESGVRVWRVE